MAVQLVALLENYLTDIERCETDVINNEDSGDDGGDGCISTELAGGGSVDVGMVEGPDATEDQVCIILWTIRGV